MTASTSKATDQVKALSKKNNDEVDVIENGGLSPQLSVRTDVDDDACSEIIRIEQEAKDDSDNQSALGRIAKTLQVNTVLLFYRTKAQLHKIYNYDGKRKTWLI